MLPSTIRRQRSTRSTIIVPTSKVDAALSTRHTYAIVDSNSVSSRRTKGKDRIVHPIFEQMSDISVNLDQYWSDLLMNAARNRLPNNFVFDGHRLIYIHRNKARRTTSELVLGDDPVAIYEMG